MVNGLLDDEPGEQNKYLTLLPVIHDASIEFNGSRYDVAIEFSLYKQGTNKRLGSELFRKNIRYTGKRAAAEFTSDEWMNLRSQIGERILHLGEWAAVDSVVARERKNYTSFPQFDDAVFPADQSVHYFSQSDLFYHNPKPSAPSLGSFRVQKCNMYIVRPTNATNSMMFEFSISEEYPSVLYAYIILTDKKVIKLDRSNFHIEQSPEAIPNDTYTDKRFLVIDLPGITRHALVTFAIKYDSRETYDTAYLSSVKKEGRAMHFARDIAVWHSADTTPWQARILIPTPTCGDTARVFSALNNLQLTRSSTRNLSERAIANRAAHSKKNSLFSHINERLEALWEASEGSDYSPNLFATSPMNKFGFKLFVFEGKPTLPPPSYSETYGYWEPPLLRLSTAQTWDSCYSSLRDSISAIIKRGTDVVPTSSSGQANDTAARVFAFCKYFSDSMRYMHVSLGAHKTIPAAPDSTLKARLGDCKDFSALLISQLKHLNIDAVPALVHSSWPNSIFSPEVPSYDAFDHMVVYVPRYRWWIDPVYAPLAPNVIPDYLTGRQALLLWRDSLSIVRVDTNSDSVNRGVLRYEIAVAGNDLHCTQVDSASCDRSAYLRVWLPKVDSSKFLDLIAPPTRLTRRYSLIENGIHLDQLDDFSKPVTITRKFTAQNAVTQVGTLKLLNLPEIPLAWFITLVGTNDRTTDLYLPTSLMTEIDVEIKGNYSAQWPSIAKIKECAPFMTAKRISAKKFRVRFRVPKGLMNLESYRRFKLSLESFRDFFSTPIALKAGS